jgi:hypothetical protein
MSTKYWVLMPDNTVSTTQVEGSAIQSLVEKGSNPKICKVGESTWVSADAAGFVKAPVAPPPPPPVAPTPPPPPAAQEVVVEVDIVDEAPPVTTEATNYLNQLLDKVAQGGIDETELLEWSRESGFAKKKARTLKGAFDEPSAQKLLAKWDVVIGVVLQRTLAKQRTSAQSANQQPQFKPAQTNLPFLPPSTPVIPAVSAPAPDPDAPMPVYTPPPMPAVPVAPVQVPTAVIVHSQTASSLAQMSGGAITGDFEESDFRLPTMKITQGNSPLVTEFGIGAVLVSGQVLMAAPPVGKIQQASLTVVPAAFRKNFTENLPYDPNGPSPRTLETLQEVAMEGGTTRWNGNTPPSWIPSARVLFLIQKPQDPTHPAFNSPIFTQEADDGTLWGVAVVWCRKTSYTYCAKEIISAARGALMSPKGLNLALRKWTLTYQLVEAGDYRVWTPKLQMTAQTAPHSIQLDAANFTNAFASGVGVEADTDV